VVAIDGRSGAGKSELAGELAIELATAGGTPVQVVRLDDVYPGWDGLRAATGLIRRWLLAPLASGRPAGYFRYDWTRGTFGPWVPVTAGGVLLLEGVGSGATALAPYRSLLVWVEAPDEVRRERALGRDGPVLDAHWDRWADQEVRYLAEDGPQDRADLIIGSG
jgi:hypothetical protein